MYDAEELKVLCGNTIEEDEVDYDDDEFGDPAVDSGLMQYYFVNVIDYMNHPELKENYMSVIGHIRKYSTKHQQLLAMAIIQNIPDKYDFQFSATPDPFYSQDDINELYKFIEFVEYDHEKFIVSIWKGLNPDTNSIQLQNFCEHNIPKILAEIEEHLELHYYPEMIADFLRTYNKDKLIEWFCEKSVNLRSSILIALYERSKKE